MSNNNRIPRIMIQLNILNFDKDLVSQIILKLQNKSLKLGLRVTIVFDSYAPYWKYPEETMCFFYVYSNFFIKIKDFVRIFSVKFDYTKGPVYVSKNLIKCSYIEEEATWSAYNDKGTLINEKNITWASIYTNAVDPHLKYDS